MLILPLLPLSHILIPVRAFDLPCQSHAHRAGWLLEQILLAAWVLAPRAATPRIACCPPGQLCTSRCLSVPIWEGSWGNSHREKRRGWGAEVQEETVVNVKQFLKPFNCMGGTSDGSGRQNVVCVHSLLPGGLLLHAERKYTDLGPLHARIHGSGRVIRYILSTGYTW